MREWKTRHRLNRYVVTDISRNTKQLLVLNVFFLLKVLDEGMFISFVGYNYFTHTRLELAAEHFQVKVMYFLRLKLQLHGHFYRKVGLLRLLSALRLQRLQKTETALLEKNVLK